MRHSMTGMYIYYLTESLQQSSEVVVLFVLCEGGNCSSESLSFPRSHSYKVTGQESDTECVPRALTHLRQSD